MFFGGQFGCVHWCQTVWNYSAGPTFCRVKRLFPLSVARASAVPAALPPLCSLPWWWQIVQLSSRSPSWRQVLPTPSGRQVLAGTLTPQGDGRERAGGRAGGDPTLQRKLLLLWACNGGMRGRGLVGGSPGPSAQGRGDLCGVSKKRPGSRTPRSGTTCPDGLWQNCLWERNKLPSHLTTAILRPCFGSCNYNDDSLSFLISLHCLQTI